MTFEEKLTQYILAEYKSLQNFATASGINYQTLVSILKRGLDNANVSNIKKICKTLRINMNDFVDGKITPVSDETPNTTELGTVNQRISEMLLTVDGKPLRETEKEMLINSIDIAIELIKRKRG